MGYRIGRRGERARREERGIKGEGGRHTTGVRVSSPVVPRHAATATAVGRGSGALARHAASSARS